MKKFCKACKEKPPAYESGVLYMPMCFRVNCIETYNKVKNYINSKIDKN